MASEINFDYENKRVDLPLSEYISLLERKFSDTQRSEAVEYMEYGNDVDYGSEGTRAEIERLKKYL